VVNATTTHKTPWGLLGAVAAVIAVEAAVARLDLDLTPAGNIDWRQARRAAERKAPGCDLLCFGTSMVQQGVYPRVIEQRAGLRGQNLGVYAGRAPYGYYLFRRALAAGARPSAVILDVHPAFVASPYEVHDGYPDLLGLRDCADMAWTLKDAGFLVGPLLRTALPSVYQRHTIRSGVVAALRGRYVSMRFANLRDLRIHRKNQGALVTIRNTEYRGGIADNYRMMLMDRAFRCIPEDRLYLRRFLDLAAARGVRVYWLAMPLAPALQHGREVKGRDAEYTEFVESFVREYPGLTVLDARRSGYGHSVFTDACHLDPLGAFALSSDVAEYLRRARRPRPEPAPGDGRARWVNLPAYRERTIDVPIENAVEAAMAVLQATAVRR